MSTPARQVNDSGKSVAAFSELSRLQYKIASPMARGVNPFTAFSFEFVAKPEEAASAVLVLPAAIQSALEDFAGFAGSLVMVSDSEARLFRVIIFWQGSEARQSCAQSVRALLAHLPAPQALSIRVSSIDTSFITSDSMAQEEHACVA